MGALPQKNKAPRIVYHHTPVSCFDIPHSRSMGLVLSTYSWPKFMVNVGKYGKYRTWSIWDIDESCCFLLALSS